MNVFIIVAVWIIGTVFIYAIVLSGKQADIILRKMTNKKFRTTCPKALEDSMESQREVKRVIEKAIAKGSAPVHFDEMGFAKDSYHLIESKAKLDELLNYFFRNGAFAPEKSVTAKSNVYMENFCGKLRFRQATSDMDRRNMEVSAKRYIKKKHPSYDGHVYVENVRCFLKISEEELEKRKIDMKGQSATALIFSKEHLQALYLQCLMTRKEAAINTPELPDYSEIENRIFKLDNVDVLFQCLQMDTMDMENDRLYVHFSTVYILENKEIGNN